MGSSRQTLTSSQRKLDAKASKKLFEELQRQCEQRLKMQQSKSDLEHRKIAVTAKMKKASESRIF